MNFIEKDQDGNRLVDDRRQIMSEWEPKSRDQMIKMMDEEIASLPTESQRLSVMFDIHEYSYPYDENSYKAFFMLWRRPETEEEKIKRETQEATMAALQTERDRREFERLSKVFSKEKK